MMFALLLAIQASTPAPAPPWYGGRLISTRALHLGIRPAIYVDRDETAVGFTVQLSCNAL